MIILILIVLVVADEPKLISEADRAPNKLEPACEEGKSGEEKPAEEDDEKGPEEFTLKTGTLYKISDSEWYLRAVDSVTKSTYLLNLNDINRVKFKEKELEAEKPAEPEEQSFKEFEWTPLIAFEAFPKNRGGHAIHGFGDYFLLFGGCFLDFKCFDDLFLFNSRTKVWSNPKMFGSPPTGRTGFGSFVNGARLYVFGGHTLQGVMNDLYVFDIESRSWNKLFWPGPVPSPRAQCKAVMTTNGGLLFGGYIGETYSNEIYTLDVVNERWGKPTAGGETPVGRESFSMVNHHQVTYVFYGYGVGNVLNDVYTLTDDLIWSKKELFGKVPSPRQGMAVAEYDNRIFMAGGCNPQKGECYNDLYSLDTTTTHVSAVTAFMKRNLKAVEYASMVFMGPLLIHFGGCELFRTCSDSMIALKIADMESCPTCRNEGECRAGHCSCPQGWAGIDCTVKVLCRSNCLNQGTCMSNGYCRCYPGYSGSVCQIIIPCLSNCTDAEHGECQMDGKCKCKDGFSGEDCDGDSKKMEITIECENDCSNKGECNEETGLCACEDGFSGPDCSVIDGGGDEDDYKSIWELLKDDDAEPEKATTVLKLKEFLANGLKFDQRQEGPVPIFQDDVEKIYYTDGEEEGDIDRDGDQALDHDESYRHHSMIAKDNVLQGNDGVGTGLNYYADEGEINIYDEDERNQGDEYDEWRQFDELDNEQQERHEHHHHKHSEHSQHSQHSDHQPKPTVDVTQQLTINPPNPPNQPNPTTPLTTTDQEGNQLMMVPPGRSKKKKKEPEYPFELLTLDECPKRCSEHGACVENKCYCWFGYSGEVCQASKIKHFYIGVRRKNVILSCALSFLLGLIIGYVIVVMIKKRGVEDEFKNISELNSDAVEDNDGEVEELIV